MERRWLAFALLWVWAGAARAAAPETSCIGCHTDAALFGTDRLHIAEILPRSVHGEAGLSCHDCHGGNPDPALVADAAGAMDPDFGPSPYTGAPTPAEVPGFCGRCHSDPDTMRRFAPAVRVDQERAYWTSRHGRALRAGDTQVATCIDCHGSHDILRTGDPSAPVFPTRIAETCASCHASAERMRGRRRDDGQPLPIDQYSLWRQSVHAEALLEKEDLSAPTCNDCHGNHGAAPPEVSSVSHVCGVCHGREASLFGQSPKSEGLERHNAFLASVGEAGCAGCHAEPEPQAALTGVSSLGQCAACHGSHAILRPTLAMLSPLPDAPCSLCHEGPGPEWDQVWGGEAVAEHYRTVRDQLLASAAQQGLEGEERFDWLVDVALSLPFHTLPAEEGEPRLRPEFERLFRKFRIGKTHFTYRDPATGEPVKARITRCNTCHASQPLLADAPRGLETAGELLRRMRELTVLTAMAERTLLRARRGGVDTRQALLEIDHAVDAQVALEVLVHGFSVDPQGEFVAKQVEGMEHAGTALSDARTALDELGSRRRGLIGFGVAVGVVLVLLALKIREVSERRQAGGGAVS
jgi:hypothetical protein